MKDALSNLPNLSCILSFFYFNPLASVVWRAAVPENVLSTPTQLLQDIIDGQALKCLSMSKTAEIITPIFLIFFFTSALIFFFPTLPKLSSPSVSYPILKLSLSQFWLSLYWHILESTLRLHSWVSIMKNMIQNFICLSSTKWCLSNVFLREEIALSMHLLRDGSRMFF